MTAYTKFVALVGGTSVLLACATPASGPSAPSGTAVAERMYVFDCGVNRAADMTRWTPGLNQGRSYDFSNNCYLIKHARGLMIWDSGLADSIAASPEGVMTAGGAINARVSTTLLSQMQAIGVTPAQITHVAFSHTHGDHVGNANYFTSAKLYIQQAEYDAAFGSNPARFGFVPATYEKLRSNETVKLNGDHDVFADGSVLIISTPGHTPGHQSLLVRLPKTGAVVLTGDLAHLQDNWIARRVPAMNVSAEQTQQSMQKVADLVAANKAQLWINHDRAISEKIAKSPQFID
jgi:N-acyl homoserine lactone hydrolase